MNTPGSRPIFLKFRLVSAIIVNFFVRSTVAFAVESPAPLLGNGSALHFPEDGLSIIPPSGWEISKNMRGMTLLMQMPRPKTPITDYSKPLYTRNITLALQHQAQPIDEMQAEALRAQLEKTFGQAPGVRNFQIMEHRFIDYRGDGKAILVYTAFDYNSFPMNQMHIYTAGAKKGVLLTYTDLAEEFQKNEAASTAAWNSMMSIELEGKAPQRFEKFIPLLAATGVFLCLAALLIFFRRRRNRRFFESAEHGLYADDEVAPKRRKSRTVSSSEGELPELTHEASVLWEMR